MAAATSLAPPVAHAHCDGMDGPVVQAAQQALAQGEVALVLMWVQPDDEPELRAAFEHALAVRALGAQARELADRYFFETLVRVHRAGEGAPYTGLKPAGRDLAPAIVAGDQALKTGDTRRLLAFLAGEMAEGLQARFSDTQSRKAFKPGDVSAGRSYVAAYVDYIHYVEGLHAAIAGGARGHAVELAVESLPPAHHAH